MARLTYKPLIGSYSQLYDLYDGAVSLFEPVSNKHATYETGGTGNVITFDGTGFKYDPQGLLKDGTITAVHFSDSNGGDFAVAGHMNFDAALLMHKLENGGIGALLEKAFHGDDEIIGTRLGDVLYGGNGADKLAGHAGHDYLHGDRGNDILTGGLGADVFVFGEGKGQDVVTDFDVFGADHDFINIATVNSFTIEKHGHDVVIELDSGDTITLLDVRRSEFHKDFITQDL